MTTASLSGMIQKVGGDRNATLLAGAAGVGIVWFIGRRKAAKAQQAPVSTTAQGYADTAQDPTALYTGYDQLQQEIDDLRNAGAATPGAGSGVTNPNPIPVPTSTGAPTPVAPTPAPPPDQVAIAVNKLEQGQPLAPAQIKAIQTPISELGPSGPLATGYGQANYGPGPGGGGGGGGGGRRNPWWG